MTKTTEKFVVTITKKPGQRHDDTREQIMQALNEEVDAGYFEGVTIDDVDEVLSTTLENKTEHVAQFCQVPGCGNEAERFIGDPSDKYTNNTFYFCLEHPETEQAEEEGFMANSAGQVEEVCVYSCAETCADCNP